MGVGSSAFSRGCRSLLAIGSIVPYPDAELTTMEIFTGIDDLVIGVPKL